MMDIIILKEKTKEPHPLLLLATKESIAKFAPVSVTYETVWFPSVHQNNAFFCLSPGDIFIRPPYDTVLSCTGSYVKLDSPRKYGGDYTNTTYYSREVEGEFKYTETPVFHRNHSDDPTGSYLNFPLVKRLKVNTEALDKAQKEHKKINIGPFFFNHARDEVEFIFNE